jgi:hypothetical protein
MMDYSGNIKKTILEGTEIVVNGCRVASWITDDRISRRNGRWQRVLTYVRIHICIY